MDTASTRQWTDEDIQRALGAWDWAPDGSEVIETAEYRVVFRPATFDRETSVPWVDSARRAVEIAHEVLLLARERGFGRGTYRAIQADRTRWARQQGVQVLLVSGRLATSAPIMERLGSTLHGLTRSIAVPTL